MNPFFMSVFWLLAAAMCAWIGNWLAFGACLGAAGAEMQLMKAQR
jgi:hypothetical protein